MEVKNEFLFHDHNNLEIQDVTKRIDEIIKEDSSILYKRGNVNEWINLDERYLITKEAKPQYIKFVKYVDELYTDLFTKMKLINTLANMIVVGHIPIESLDINSLYVVTDYFQNVKAEEYQKQFKMIGNKDILLLIRYNTLDSKKRKSMLEYIIKRFEEKRVDYNNSESINQCLSDLKKELTITPIEQLINGD